MRFQTKNELRLFNFEEAQIRELVSSGEQLTVIMDAVVVKGNNPNNEEFVDRYADTLNLRFCNRKLLSIVKEGYKYYDANDRLVEEKEDEIIPTVQYDAILKRIKDVNLYDIILKKQGEETFVYEIGVDLNESDTYWIELQCSETIAEWELFLNRVQH